MHSRLDEHPAGAGCSLYMAATMSHCVRLCCECIDHCNHLELLVFS